MDEKKQESDSYRGDNKTSKLALRANMEFSKQRLQRNYHKYIHNS